MSGHAPARHGRHISSLRVVRRPVAVVVLALGLLLAGGGIVGLTAASQTGHAAMKVPKPGFVAIPKGQWAAAPVAEAQQVAKPVRLIIPAIGVRTRLVHLGVTKAGTLQVPTSIHVAGWFTGSPRPGEAGGAVIVGHIDNYLTYGIFYYLKNLRRGDHVFVRRADRSLAVFRVSSVHTYLKTRFPTAAVYGPTPSAQLRLITCGGRFDPQTGHYLSNTIVYASLVH